MNASPGEPRVVVDDVTFTYPGRDLPTLREISTKIEPGSLVLVTGRSGSGKSTLLRALAGWIPHHSGGRMRGRVTIAGCDTRTARPGELAQRVGLLLQSPDDQMCTTTCGAEVAFGLANLALPPATIAARVSHSLTDAGLAGYEERSPRSVSGGQKQRLLLAAVLAMRPGMLLLDEPLAQLDPSAASELLAALEGLRRSGLAVVVVEHRLDELWARADRVLVLDAGQLAADVSGGQHEALAHALGRAGLALPELLEVARAFDCATDGTVEALAGQLPRLAPVGPTIESATARDDGERTRVAGLAFGYPGEAHRVWSDVTFTIRDGDRIALVGANGSGKSTLLAVLAGLERPTSGTVQMFNGNTDRGRDWGLVLQNVDLMLFCATVGNELAYGPRQLGWPVDEVRQAVARAAAVLDLEALLDEPPQALSQGQRLRVAVAATLAMWPRVLLLDEPTTGQDQPQMARTMHALATAVSGGERPLGALIFSTHDVRAVARFANRVLVLADGRLVADLAPEALLADDGLLARARLHRPPLLELRQRLGLRGLTPSSIIEELRS